MELVVPSTDEHWNCMEDDAEGYPEPEYGRGGISLAFTSKDADIFLVICYALRTDGWYGTIYWTEPGCQIWEMLGYDEDDTPTDDELLVRAGEYEAGSLDFITELRDTGHIGAPPVWCGYLPPMDDESHVHRYLENTVNALRVDWDETEL
jgi:hypothetical protein